ncbi:unnamed protein product [Cuscuta europaea]|uniref:Uncharacterized protein n=1 Tax=Cuscuta europaea TaxID=41803 RepID=A0A9P0YIW1_CUSEU|nr:unnamed protein product [Cuscuta europaea]
MGNCCVSSGVKLPPHSQSAANSNRRASSLSHPLPEEETVKEVLSETQNLSKPTFRIDDGPCKHPPVTQDQEKRQDDVVPKNPAAAAADLKSGDLSEDFSASEICSTISESVPIITVTEKLDLGDEVRQRSPAKVRNRPFPEEARRARSAGRSPSRISQPSPAKIRAGVGRDSPGRSPANVKRTNNYERVGRRSVSPATRTEDGGPRTGPGWTPSMRKSGKSPGRVRSDISDKTRMLGKSFTSKNNKADSKEKMKTTDTNELLENPLVSLECFIFL